jgi:hypothetical protein
MGDGHPPRLLELFCGSKSVGKAAVKFGYEVTSVDILSKFEPTITCDILKFDYKQFKIGHFQYIHASPPCTEFSFAKSVGVRKIDEATAIVMKAMEIIEYLKPTFWLVENPLGWLRYQPCMKQYAAYLTTVCYCKYGFGYKKNTDLWTNVPYTPRPRCVKGTFCAYKAEHGYHQATVQKGIKGNGGTPSVTQRPTTKMMNRYAIPEDLLVDLLCNDIFIV